MGDLLIQGLFLASCFLLGFCASLAVIYRRRCHDAERLGEIAKELALKQQYARYRNAVRLEAVRRVIEEQSSEQLKLAAQVCTGHGLCVLGPFDDPIRAAEGTEGSTILSMGTDYWVVSEVSDDDASDI